MSEMRPQGRLFRKYVVVLVALVGGVLIASGGVELYLAYKETKRAVVSVEREKAIAAAERIEQFIKEIERHIRGTIHAVTGALADGASRPEDSAPAQSLASVLTEQRELDFLQLLRNMPVISELRHIDISGKEQLRVSRFALDAIGSGEDFSRAPAFVEAKARATYFSPVYFRNDSEPYMTIGVPAGDTVIEVTVAEVSLKAVWDVASQIRIGRLGYAYVVDARGRLIAHPDVSLVLQMRDLSGLSHVKAAREGGASTLREHELAMVSAGLDGRQALITHAAIPSLGWLVFVEQPLGEVFAPLRLAMLWGGMIVVIGLLLSVLASVVLARRMVAPIRRLQEGAARVGQGELDYRINIRTGDELEALADQFNRTAAQLQDSYQSLERKVAARTEELSRSVAELQALGKVGQAVNSTLDLDTVLSTIIAHAVQISGADAGTIYEYSAAAAVFEPRANYGLTEEMIDALRESRIGLGDTIVGKSAMQRVPMQISDVAQEGDLRLREVLLGAGIHAVLAMPLLREERVIGALSIRRRAAGEFAPSVVTLLQTFASQSVLAIENARLFQEIQANSKELEARTQELTRTVEEMKALSEIGQAVSSTLELQTVLTTIVTHAVQLTETDAGTIYEYDEAAQQFILRATYGMSEEHIALLQQMPMRVGEGAVGRAATAGEPVQIPDILEQGAMEGRAYELNVQAGFRALLAVPLIREDRIVALPSAPHFQFLAEPLTREDRIIGGLVVRRRTPGEFPARVVELLRTLAAQSALAIQNARLFREIDEKSEQLAAASQHKSQFLANMSHELRTPMNAIIGVGEMMLEDARDAGQADQIEPLERILRAAQHLLALINDILDLSKIEAGKMELHLEDFSIAPLVEEVAATVLPMAEKNGNRVTVECMPDLGVMHADATRVRQALLNLASNAVKFTEKGTVTISAARESTDGSDTITLRVRDSGIGMTPEQTARLFHDFEQVDASTTRKYGGTGLGLAISRRFCRMMGGDIMVESALGRGSTFTIRLPAAVVVSGTTEPTAGRALTEPLPKPTAKGRRDAATVLVVDDDPTVRVLMERFLGREGYKVTTAKNGIEGLERAREIHPAAITLDVMMPDIDGWTVLAALKGDPALADIPVILVTIVDEKQRGYTLGATDYLVKPIDRERLAAVLRSLCGCSAGRLLLVEDDDTARALVRAGLEREGWDVMEANNGRIALSRLDEARPDAIVLDLVMPEMDGFEFLAELRNHHAWRDIPVVVVTALDLTEEDHRRLNGEVESVILKSGHARDELLREVSEALATCVQRRTPRNHEIAH